MVELAQYRSDPKGGFFVLARYTERGKFKIVEHLPDAAMAFKFVQQLQEDDKYRHTQLLAVRDWDFVNDKPVAEKKPRTPREKIVPVHFSFED